MILWVAKLTMNLEGVYTNIIKYRKYSLGVLTSGLGTKNVLSQQQQQKLQNIKSQTYKL